MKKQWVVTKDEQFKIALEAICSIALDYDGYLAANSIKLQPVYLNCKGEPAYKILYSEPVAKGLQHAKRWIKDEPHDDMCGCVLKVGEICDCGKLLALDQVSAAIKELRK